MQIRRKEKQFKLSGKKNGLMLALRSHEMKRHAGKAEPSSPDACKNLNKKLFKINNPKENPYENEPDDPHNLQMSPNTRKIMILDTPSSSDLSPFQPSVSKSPFRIGKKIPQFSFTLQDTNDSMAQVVNSKIKGLLKYIIL